MIWSAKANLTIKMHKFFHSLSSVVTHTSAPAINKSIDILYADMHSHAGETVKRVKIAAS